MRVEVRDPDYTPELQGRLGKLEAAISKQRTVRFHYWSIARDDERERTINPYALLPENGTWYVIGLDLEDNVEKSFRVSRIRSEIRFATRRERDFRVPESFDVEQFRGRAEWQFGDIAGRGPDRGRRRHRLVGAARVRGRAEPGRGRRLRHRVRVAAAARPLDPPPGGPRRPARALPAPPARHRGRPRRAPRARRAAAGPGRRAARPPGSDRASDRQAGPVAPERFGVLQSLLAYLLAACGEERDAVIPASELIERFSIPAEALEEHLSLLNLVNFGGGCYAVYAELHGDEVHVDKELFGDTFRRAPRLTPLEARAIRLALEFVGPMIAAGSSSPLDRVRAKLEEAFGQFDLAQTPTPQAGAEEDLVATLTRAIDRRRLVELEYLKPESTEVETRTIEPYGIERRLPHWYVHTWDVDRDAPRSYRLDRTRTAKLLTTRFMPREGFEPVAAPAGDDRPHLVLARGRPLGGREGRAAARRRRRALGAAGRQRRLARRRGALVPRRGRRARAAGAAHARRDARAASSSGGCARAARPPRPPGAARPSFRSGRVSVKVEPRPGSELTSSVPPCASAIARAM